MAGSAGSSGAAMLMMAKPLMHGNGSTSHGHKYVNESSRKPNRAEWELQQRRLRKEREEVIRSGMGYVADLERLRMPPLLPDRLCLCKTQVKAHQGDGKLATSPHAFKVAEKPCADPLLVGYRHGSRFKHKIKHISLCLGTDWYGSSCGPFLKASHGRKKKFTITYRSEYPDANSRYVRVINTAGSKQGTVFDMVVPDLAKNTPNLQVFEWLHRRSFQLKVQKPEVGTILVQHSTTLTQPPQIVARMDWGELTPHKGLIGDFEIFFMGASTTYGGTWKIVAFMIGILAFC